MTDSKPVSPCISVCVLDEEDICQGCYRTAQEITDWFMADDNRRLEILAACHERRVGGDTIPLG